MARPDLFLDLFFLVFDGADDGAEGAFSVPPMLLKSMGYGWVAG